MRKLLTAPVWQIYLLFFLPPYFIPETNSFLGPILIALWLIFLTYCVYYLVINLYEKLPESHDLKIKRFNFHLLFCLIYFIVIVFTGGYEINQDNYKEYGNMIYVILPLHLFLFYSAFYIVWFIAKAIASIEKNRLTRFDDYSGIFFLLIIFPIGIGFTHKRIQRIFTEKKNDAIPD